MFHLLFSVSIQKFSLQYNLSSLVSETAKKLNSD